MQLYTESTRCTVWLGGALCGNILIITAIIASVSGLINGRAVEFRDAQICDGFLDVDLVAIEVDMIGTNSERRTLHQSSVIWGIGKEVNSKVCS